MSDTTVPAPGDSLPVYAEIPPLGGPFGAIMKVIDCVFAVLSSAGLLAIAAVVLLQVVARVALPSAPVWTEELSRYLFIHMIAISSGLVLRRHQHVGVELFQYLMGFRAQMVARSLTCLLVTGFAIIVLPEAIKYARIGAFQTSPTLGIPMMYIFGATVILFALTAFYGVIGLIEAIAALIRGPKEPH